MIHHTFLGCISCQRYTLHSLRSPTRVSSSELLSEAQLHARHPCMHSCRGPHPNFPYASGTSTSSPSISVASTTSLASFASYPSYHLLAAKISPGMLSRLSQRFAIALHRPGCTLSTYRGVLRAGLQPGSHYSRNDDPQSTTVSSSEIWARRSGVVMVASTNAIVVRRNSHWSQETSSVRLMFPA